MRGSLPRPINGIDKYDFAKLARSEGTPRERRRFLAFAHLQDGRRPIEVARMVKVFPQTINTWINKYRKEGIDGLREKPGRGAKPYISEEEYDNLRELVEQLQKKREGGRIRGCDIGDLIEREFGRRPSRSTIYKTLNRAGLVWITGRSQHPKADIKAQEAFKKTSKEKYQK